MSRLKNNLILSSIVVSAVVAELSFTTPVFAISDEAQDFNRKGVMALEAGEYESAVQMLRKAMSLEPKWGEPCFNAARLLRMKGRREEMTKMLRKANGVEPGNPTYLEEYLKILYEDLEKAESSSDDTKVKEIRKEVLRVSPGDFKVGLKTIKDHIKLDEKDEAIEATENLINNNSRYRFKYDKKEMGEAYLLAAQLFEEKGDSEKAREYANNATKFEFDGQSEAKAILDKSKKQVGNKLQNLIADADKARQSNNYSKAKSLLEEAKTMANNDETLVETIDGKLHEINNEEDAFNKMKEAKKFISQDNWLDAREILIKLSELYPNDKKVKEMRESLADKEKALLKAIELPDIPTTASERKNTLLGFKERGTKFYKAGNHKGAIVPLKKALALIDADDNLSEYRADIEDILFKINETDEDKTTWQKAVDARNAGDYEDSLKLLKRLPTDYNIQLDSYLAEAYYKTGDSQKAEELALSQLSKQPENNRAKFVIGCIAQDAKDNSRAYRFFKEVYDADSEYPEIGDKLAATGAHQYAIPVVTFVVLGLLGYIGWQMKKNLPIYNKNAKLNNAKKMFKKEYYDECIEHLVAVRHSPYLTPADNMEITKLMAQSYLKKGRYDLAIGECKHLITIAPKNEDAHTWLGFAYLGRRMLSPEALPELLNLYKKESRNIALVSLLGSYYAQQKNLSEEGVAILEQWLNLDHENVEVLKPLGKYYLKKNRSDDKAMKVFQKMMEIGAPEADFMLGVANVYLKMHQYDNCLHLCEQVINMDINNEFVHGILLETYKKQNRLAELLDIYANFLQNNPYNVAFQHGLAEAQAAYDKLQSRNAAQAAQEAAAVMAKMNMPDMSNML